MNIIYILFKDSSYEIDCESTVYWRIMSAKDKEDTLVISPGTEDKT